MMLHVYLFLMLIHSIKCMSYILIFSKMGYICISISTENEHIHATICQMNVTVFETSVDPDQSAHQHTHIMWRICGVHHLVRKTSRMLLTISIFRHIPHCHIYIKIHPELEFRVTPNWNLAFGFGTFVSINTVSQCTSV